MHARGIESLKIARAEGVPMVFGTDLLGHMHARQSGEFDLRLGAMSPVEVLQSATIDAARLMRQEGQIGELVPGAWADLLVVEGDPTRELSMLAEPRRGPLLVMKAGRIYRDDMALHEGGSANAQHHLAPGAAVPARAAAGQNRTMSPNRTLLLTDVVDSTKLSEALGDAAMADVWAAHDRVARDLLPPGAGARSTRPTACCCSSSCRPMR